jgi:hypothetical protein
MSVADGLDGEVDDDDVVVVAAVLFAELAM